MSQPFNKSIKQITLIASGFSLILVGIFHWWFNSDLITLGVYTLIALLAVITVPLLYRWLGYHVDDQVEWLKDKEDKEHNDISNQLASIQHELENLQLTEGVRQTEVLSGIIEDYHSVVNTRFIGKKYSPMNYISAARSVQKHALQNLTDVVAIGHSMSSINRNKLTADEIDNPNKQNRQDKQAGLYADQESRIDALLEENSELFNALLETSVEVANIQSFSKFERLDTLSRLVALAEIANKTNK